MLILGHQLLPFGFATFQEKRLLALFHSCTLFSLQTNSQMCSSKARVMRDERLRYASERGSVIGQLIEPDRQEGQITQSASCSSTAKDTLACCQQHLIIMPASQRMQSHAQCMQHVCHNCQVAVSESVEGADQSCNLTVHQHCLGYCM